MSQSTPPLSSQAEIFAYTEVEAASIATLAKGSRDFLHASHPETQRRDLERALKKSVSLELHGCTLAEYYRLKRIPRGLRVHLRPTIFSENLEYCKKFEGILNKCSLEIITLTIETIQKELATVTEQARNIELQLSQAGSQEDFATTKALIEKSIQQYRQETEDRKRFKFLRDAEDYAGGNIYRWIPGRPHVTPSYFRNQPARFQPARGSQRKGRQELPLSG
ncbi:hypothetical protein XELAEV_18022452mg [Xenopus laevis]|uniref:Uncharacterized protein n=1 Tax=Xenopus laevis TaxID=8355 RepID=A0A974D2A0_XENLA|nr:hypothetical protein XELAEV_18022452mg [Xenopus laevis]